MPNRLNIENTELECMVSLYVHFAELDLGSLSLRELEATLPSRTTNVVGICLEHLVKADMVEEHARLNSPLGVISVLARALFSAPEIASTPRYRITRNGIKRVEELDFTEYQAALRNIKPLYDRAIDPPAQIPTSTVPAANRYVSVGDNQADFDQLVSHLSEIRTQFALDHNHGALAVDNLDARLSDIDIFIEQAKSGFVSRLTAMNLHDTLSYLSVCALGVAGLAQAIDVALTALKTLFGI